MHLEHIFAVVPRIPFVASVAFMNRGEREARSSKFYPGAL